MKACLLIVLIILLTCQCTIRSQDASLSDSRCFFRLPKCWIKSIQKKINEKTSMIIPIEDNLKQVHMYLRTMEEEIKMLKKQNEQLSQQNRELSEKMERESKAMNDKNTELNERISKEIKALRDDMSQQNKDLTSKIGKSDQKILSLNSSLNALSSWQTTTQTRIDSFSNTFQTARLVTQEVFVGNRWVIRMEGNYLIFRDLAGRDYRYLMSPGKYENL